jgi:hypothetical protein
MEDKHTSDQFIVEPADVVEPVADEEGEYWLGGHKPTQEEAREAVRKIKALRKGNILGDDLTIQEMIEGGRR